MVARRKGVPFIGGEFSAAARSQLKRVRASASTVFRACRPDEMICPGRELELPGDAVWMLREPEDRATSRPSRIGRPLHAFTMGGKATWCPGAESPCASNHLSMLTNPSVM